MTAEEVAEKIRKCVRLALRGATEGERAAAANRAWEERKKQDDAACREWNLSLRKARWVDRGGVMFSETPLPPRPVYVTRGRDARKQFMLGFFHALDATLAARPLRNDGARLMAERGANALRIRKLETDGLLAARPVPAGHFNWDARQAGVADGSRVSLNRPVDGAARPTLRLAAGT